MSGGGREANPERSLEQSPELPLGEALGFMQLIWKVDHALESASKHLRASQGITGPQRLVIRIVGKFPGMRAGQLAETLHLHPSTLTGVLERLRRKGLVSRRADPRDRRRALFGLTARGRHVDVRTSRIAERAVSDVLSRLPRARLRATRQVLAALAVRLETRAGSD